MNENASNPQNRFASARQLTWSAIAGGIVLFMVWAFWPDAVPVDTATIARGEMSVHVEAKGRTRVRDVYTISAPVSGRLLRIEAQAGDITRAGETALAVIEPADPSFLDTRTRAEAQSLLEAAEDARAQAGASLEQARAQLKFARGELERARELAGQGTISKRALEKAELDYSTQVAVVKSAEATLKIRTHELQTAKARLIVPDGGSRGGEDCCITITAPIDGSVLRVISQSEGVVQAGTPLLEVGDPGDLEVVVDLLTTDAARVKTGAQVTIDNWGGAPLSGMLSRIEPYGYTKVSVLGIEEQRVDAIIDFDPGTRLPGAMGHGFRVEASILEWHGNDVVVAPMSALFRTGDSWSVFRMIDATAVLVMVEIGHMNNFSAEVLSGLAPGDEVIIHPGDRVGDGVRVMPRQSP